MSWSKKRRSPGCASSKVETRTAGSAIASLSAPRATRGSSPAGRRTRVRYRTRLPSRTRPVASRLAALMSTRGPSVKSDAERSGSFPRTRGHGEARVANGERVAEREPEPAEDGLLDHGATGGEQLVERPPGPGLEPPVERIAALDRLQLDEERAALRWVPGHRRPALAPGSPRRPGAPGRGPAPPPRRRAGAPSEPRGRHRAGPAPRGRASGRARRPRSGPRRGLRRRARCTSRNPAKCRQAPRVSRQARPATRRQGSAGAPGASADGRSPHAAARSPTTRPSRSSTIRSAWAASAGSWVTRISVVP